MKPSCLYAGSEANIHPSCCQVSAFGKSFSTETPLAGILFRPLSGIDNREQFNLRSNRSNRRVNDACRRDHLSLDLILFAAPVVFSKNISIPDDRWEKIVEAGPILVKFSLRYALSQKQTGQELFNIRRIIRSPLLIRCNYITPE